MRDLVVEALLVQSPAGLGADDLHDELPLFDGGLELDSIGLLEVMLSLETAFGVQVDEDTLEESSLKTVGSLLRFFESLGAR